MLPGLASAGVVGAAAGSRTLLYAIQNLGLTSGLKLCLDAGDGASVVTGSQTKWLDVSGNGTDFFRGATGSSEGSDPTFNGSPAGETSSEYWGLDGGDYFTYDTTNETWMQNLHKNNATWGFVAWVYGASSGSSIDLFGTNAGGTATGVRASMRLDGTSTQFVYITNGSTGVANLNITHGSSLASRWSFFAASISEPDGTSALRINNVTASPSSTYTSPSSGSAGYTMQIMAMGNGFGITPSGTRAGAFAMWEGTYLDDDDLTAIYTATRTRFGV
jgi:hypothetical protein